MQDEWSILCDIVLKRAKRVVITITGESGTERMSIHRGDRKGHNSTTTMERTDEFQVRLLPHPSYSLDISSSDFSSFSQSKGAMQGQEFQAPEAVWAFILDFCRTLDSGACLNVPPMDRRF
jgi:hypothetical protein